MRIAPLFHRCLVAAAPLLYSSPGLAVPATGSSPVGPIKVGAVSSIALFPESTAAVRAYFDAVNAAGGIRGRKLQLIVEDDKADPAAAASAARKLIDKDEVVANVGSASALECAVNASMYVERNIVSIQGTGVDPVCFGSPAISPVNTGPYVSVAAGLQFLADIRKRKRICLVTIAYSPLQKPVFEQVVADWTRRSGRTVTYSAIGVDPSADPSITTKAVADARCEGVVYQAIEPAVLAMVRSARSMKVEGIDWVFLAPAYTANVAAVLGKDGDGIFAMSEFEPWSSRSGMLSDWRNVMTKSKVPLTSFSQAGYVAASVFVSVLRGIEGNITRTSVADAFKSMADLRVPLMGSPYSFGTGTRHNPNRAAVPVRLDAGRWVVAHWEYIVVPEIRD